MRTLPRFAVWSVLGVLSLAACSDDSGTDDPGTTGGTAGSRSSGGSSGSSTGGAAGEGGEPNEPACGIAPTGVVRLSLPQAKVSLAALLGAPAAEEITLDLEIATIDRADLPALGGEGHVDIRAEFVPGEEETAGLADPLPPQISVEVRDNGPGIAPDDLERIFSPFFTTKPQGTGLGLAIVRKVVDAHDGRIDAVSAPGRGATFKVTLPVVPSERSLER